MAVASKGPWRVIAQSGHSSGASARSIASFLRSTEIDQYLWLLGRSVRAVRRDRGRPPYATSTNGLSANLKSYLFSVPHPPLVIADIIYGSLDFLY